MATNLDRLRNQDPTTPYRQHRCGEVGYHRIHLCRYCGRPAKAVGTTTP